MWLLAWFVVDRQRLWGQLPFANGHVEGILATWDRREGVVVLVGVHPSFVAACRAQQGSS